MDGEQVPVEVTGRDVATLRWVARWWAVTVVQVDRWWRLPGSAGLHGDTGAPRIVVVRRRLAGMERAGLVVAHRMPTSPAYLYAITGPGLQVAGLSAWTVPRWRWSQFRHEHTATSVSLELLEAGFDVVPERVMRQEDTLGIGDWSLVLAGTGEARSHYPDLWVRPTGASEAGWRAVEIELARKSLGRLSGILAAYRDRGTPVTYYTGEASVAQAVRRAASRVGLADLDVRRLGDLATARAGTLTGVGVSHG